jgi:hypothetical protein
MSHFADTNWHNPSGLVASLETTANAVKAATGTTSTEGTNQLTHVVRRTGLYRLSSYLRLRAQSTAGTSHTLAATASYNNGTAITAASIGQSGVTPGTLDAKAGTVGTAVLLQSETVLASASTSIIMAVLETVSGTGAVGTYDIFFAIEAV